MELSEVATNVAITLTSVNVVLISAMTIDRIIRKLEERRRVAYEEKRKREASLEVRISRIEAALSLTQSEGDRIENLERGVRENGKKADAALDLRNAAHVDIKALQASVNRLESYFETPKLKSS